MNFIPVPNGPGLGIIRQLFTIDKDGEVSLTHYDGSSASVKIAGLDCQQASDVIRKSRKAGDLRWDEIRVDGVEAWREPDSPPLF